MIKTNDGEMHTETKKDSKEDAKGQFLVKRFLFLMLSSNIYHSAPTMTSWIDSTITAPVYIPFQHDVLMQTQAINSQLQAENMALLQRCNELEQSKLVLQERLDSLLFSEKELELYRNLKDSWQWEKTALTMKYDEMQRRTGMMENERDLWKKKALECMDPENMRRLLEEAGHVFGKEQRDSESRPAQSAESTPMTTPSLKPQPPTEAAKYEAQVPTINFRIDQSCNAGCWLQCWLLAAPDRSATNADSADRRRRASGRWSASSRRRTRSTTSLSMILRCSSGRPRPSSSSKTGNCRSPTPPPLPPPPTRATSGRRRRRRRKGAGRREIPT
jgi:hypothetical protein